MVEFVNRVVKVEHRASVAMKEMLLWRKDEEHNGTMATGNGTCSGGGSGNGYVSLRSSSGSILHVGTSSGSGNGNALLRCCVYRLANVNIRRWILALVLITVISIVCYTRLIDAPFST